MTFILCVIGCDVNYERAVVYKEKLGFIRCYADYKKMLQIEKPDAVCVLVSESDIANISSQVMSMGFPLFVEKPPGKTSVETNRLIEIVNRRQYASNYFSSRAGRAARQ